MRESDEDKNEATSPVILGDVAEFMNLSMEQPQPDKLASLT